MSSTSKESAARTVSAAHTVKRLTLTCALALPLLSACATTTEANEVKDSQSRPFITVLGSHEMKVEPDRCVVTLTVATASKDLVDARTRNNARTNALVDRMKALKIPDDHVRTQQIQVNPQYDYVNRKREFREWSVRRNMTILVEPLDDLEKVLSASLESAEAEIGGMSFESSKMDEYRDDVRVEAVKAARERARRMAAAVDRKLGDAVAIVESGASVPRPVAAPEAFMAMDSRAKSAVADPETAPGQIRVYGSVQVTFELR